MTYTIDGFDVIERVFNEREVSLARELVTAVIARFRAGEATVVAACESLAALTRRLPSRNPEVRPEDCEAEPYIVGDLIALDTRFAILFTQRKLWRVADERLSVSRRAVRTESEIVTSCYA